MSDEGPKARHERLSQQVLAFAAVLDGAILAGVTQLAGWARPFTTQVETAAIVAVAGALGSIAVIAAVYLMREGLAYADRREVSEVLEPSSREDPRRSRWRHRFVANGAKWAFGPAALGAWAYGVALVVSLLG